MAAISQPALRAMLTEMPTLVSYAAIRPRETGGVYQYWLALPFYANNHMDGSNLLFADGHVKWRKQSSLCANDWGLQNSSVSGANACGVTSPNSATAALDPDF